VAVAVAVGFFLFGRAAESWSFAGAQPEVEKGAHHGGEGFELQGFDEEGIGAEVVGTIDVLDVFRRGEDDDTQPAEGGAFSDFLKNLEAVHPGHFEIEQKDVGQGVFVTVGVFADAIEVSEAFFAIGNDEEGVLDAAVFKGAPDEEDVIGQILGQENDRIIGQIHVISLCSLRALRGLPSLRHVSVPGKESDGALAPEGATELVLLSRVIVGPGLCWSGARKAKQTHKWSKGEVVGKH
jgi:hypothetical protein